MKKSGIKEIGNVFKKMLFFLSVMVVFGGFLACSNDDDESEKMGDKPKITVLMGFNGKGNQDYSALIYKAIDKWQHHPDVDMQVFYPKTNEEAAALYQDWYEKTANGVRSLMVPANGQFEYMVKNSPLELKDNQQVLAFEMKWDQPIKGVKCFELSHSGISYLAGRMASKYKKAAVFIGHRTPMLDHAASCFKKGYGNDGNLDILEISDHFNGFNMADRAKQMAQQHRDAFILPLAGLSNEGVYDFLKECDADDPITASGMDVNCNEKSKRIPFSYIVNIDKAIDWYLQCWLEGKPWPSSKLGLEDGMMSIVINPDYEEMDGVSKADLEKLYHQYFKEACLMD